MKRILFFVFFLPLLGFSQQTPEFSFELYFEDAAGNKDTVTIGYDPNATDSIDSIFGEINIIEEPWGDGLDVRVGNKLYSKIYDKWFVEGSDGYPNYDMQDNTYLTKKQILATYCYGAQYQESSGSVSLQIYSDNFPIKIKWDKALFSPITNNFCRLYSSFIHDYYNLSFDTGGLWTLKDFDSTIIYKQNNGTEDIYYHASHNLNFYSDEDKNIVVLQFVFLNDYAAGISYAEVDDFTVYPNPIQKGGNISVDFIGSYSLFNTQGKLLQTGEVQNKQIPTNKLQKGMYLLRLENDKTHYQTKIIVQ